MKPTIDHNIKNKLSSLFMILALLWLTVSLPFVIDARQKAFTNNVVSTISSDSNEKSVCSIGSNTNNTEEEKPASSVAGSSFSVAEEFLHHQDDLFHAVEVFLSHQVCHAAKEYVAFHGDLVTPPPNSFF